jgi:hypothetical protein|tara:strand:+ start:552 stop:1355 length:804 start_codon:yes stop_codon:yes gene_type:complete
MNKQNKNILNINNYNSKLENNELIMQEYNVLINEYLSHISKQLLIKDNIHYLFVINRGIDLLKNIFIILLHYTKNLELVIHHLRKSYLYYTEFIGQVGEDSNSFLQLNSKDACLFVYKKTIYDINEDFKKKYELTEDEKKQFFNLKENIYLYTQIIKIFCKNYIDGDNIFLKDERDIYIKTLNNFMIKILNILKKIKKENYEIIHLFIDYIECKNFLLERKQTLIYHFIKKMIVSDINIGKIYKLAVDDENYVLLTPIKFINKLFRK